MNRYIKNRISFICLILLLVFSINSIYSQKSDKLFVTYIVNPKEKKLQLYWKDSLGNIYSNFKNLKKDVEKNGDSLVFAMNGGMYNKDRSPQGLYVGNGKVLKEIDTAKSGFGNFYMYPNGVFYLKSDYTPVICKTDDYSDTLNVLYATQSGPLLLIDGEIHNRFMKGSKNLNIRNGVGVLANGNLIFAMSKDQINFYDFASYFKSKGCKNALYLDGFVSKTYLPSENWIQIDGNFGVIIGVLK